MYGPWCHVDRQSTREFVRVRLKNAGLMLFADCLLTREKTIEFVDVKDGTFSIFLHGYESLLNDFRIQNDQNTKQEMSLKQENTKLTPVLPRHFFLLKRQMNNYHL